MNGDGKMKIYLASSWKNEPLVLQLAKLFRAWGHWAYCFAEHTDNAVIFHWDEVMSPDDDGITCLDTDYSRGAFANDKAGIDEADCCILLNPSGRDAHLEAGFMKGQGKLLFIIGEFPKGEFSNMYHFADGLFRLDDYGYNALRERLDG